MHTVLIMATGQTGSSRSPEVQIPAQRDDCAVTAIISAPMSDMNVFDLSFGVEVFEPRSDEGAWRIRDLNRFARDLVSGPREAINIAVSTRLERVSGKKVRAWFACGASPVAVSLVVSW